MFKFQRDFEQEPYWSSNRFWPQFIENSSFDHAYLVDAFKTIVGDCEYRVAILRHFLKIKSVIFNEYSPNFKDSDRIVSVRKCWAKAKEKKLTAFITWEYPPILDEYGNQESHCVVFIADPLAKKVISIDSRGTKFVLTMGKSWENSLQSIKDVFKDCETWIDAVTSDLQNLNPNDHFCQTWSLILTIVIVNNDDYREINSLSTTLTHHLPQVMVGFAEIVLFWKNIIQIERFKEALYYEIYRKTHRADGSKQYNRYFTTLESLVTTSNDIYYPFAVSYKDTGYEFIEGFLDVLDESTMKKILS